MMNIRTSNSAVGALSWLHWLVLATSLAITIAAWEVSSGQIEDKSRQRFEGYADQIVAMVAERMRKYEDALWSGVAAMSLNNGPMDYQEWKRFAEALQIEQKYPGTNGIGVVYYVTSEKLPAYLQTERELRPGYSIYPPHSEKEYWPITYVEPESINAKAIGLDMAFETNRFTAAKLARDTGRAQITAPITLVQDDKHTPGFLLYAPFYAGGTIPGTVEDRRSRFVGHVYAPFIMNKLMQGTLGNANRLVNIRITDQSTTIFDELSSDSGNIDHKPLFQKSVNIDMYGRPWVIDIHAAQSFRSQVQNNQPTYILIGGLLIDGLLLLLFLSLARARQRAGQIAARMTKDVHELKTAMENAVEGVATLDPQGRYTFVNEAYAGACGYQPSELVGVDWQITVHKDDLPHLTSEYQRMMTEGKVAPEARGVRKDGSIFYKQVTMIPNFADDGTFTGHYCFMRDISERKRHEQALAQQAMRLQAVMDTVLDGLITFDATGQIKSFNSAAERIFGYTENEAQKKNVSSLIEAADQDWCDKILAKRERTDTASAGSNLATGGLRKNGEKFPVELGVNKMLFDGEPMFVATVRDVTERAAAEKDRDDLLSSLIQSNQELERFAYVASHDMQEPLRMITSFSAIIAKDYREQLDDTGKEYLQLVIDAGQRMRVMVDDLLEYARLGNDAMTLIPMDAGKAIGHAIDNLAALIKDRHAAVTVDPMPVIQGNPVQFVRMMQNLIANAIRYQPPGNQPQIHIGLVDDGDAWRIVVKDNGMGIEPQYLDQIFLPFRRLHGWHQEKGTGLGLAVCRKIAENHKGHIRVTSTPGSGSEFSITLAKCNVSAETPPQETHYDAQQTLAS